MNDKSLQTPSQIRALLTLVQLQRQARHIQNIDALSLFFVNDLHRLIPYQQAIFWQPSTTGVQINAISNVSNVEANAPYSLWLKQLISDLKKSDVATTIHVINEDSTDEKWRQGWQEWNFQHVLWCPLNAPQEQNEQQNAGLILLRDTPWQDSELVLLDTTLDAYAHALHALKPKRSFFAKAVFRFMAKRRVQFLFITLMVLALFIPVHETVLAPAEITPFKALIASAPLAGTIEKIYVTPNQAVQKDDLLFSLNDTQLRSNVLVAQQAEAIAQADYLRASQKAFNDSNSLAQVAILRAQVGEKSAELAHAQEQLDRIQVRAEQNGIAVFADPNDWLGRPVSVGEKVMQIAKPEQVELKAWVSVADAITLQSGARVRLFLNTDPINPLEATLYQAAFEAEVTDQATLAFRIRARFNEQATPPRIGLKGTAKIYGNKVLLGYYLFRRPLAATRQWLGW